MLKTARPWPARVRRVSVQFFGFGGSNSHVVMDEARSFLAEHGLPGNHATRADGEGLDKQPNDRAGDNAVEDMLPKLLIWSFGDKAGLD